MGVTAQRREGPGPNECSECTSVRITVGTEVGEYLESEFSVSGLHLYYEVHTGLRVGLVRLEDWGTKYLSDPRKGDPVKEREKPESQE